MRLLKSLVDVRADRSSRVVTLGYAIFTMAASALAIYGWHRSAGYDSYFVTSDEAYLALEAAGTKWAIIGGVSMFMAFAWPLILLSKAVSKARTQTSHIRFYRHMSLALLIAIFAMAVLLIFHLSTRVTAPTVACVVDSTGQTTCRNQ